MTSKREALLDIRAELTELYPGEEDILRVAEDAGMTIVHVQVSQKAVNTWRSVLSEADKQRAIPELVRVVRREYPSRPALERALAQYNEALAVEEGHVPPSARSRQIAQLIDARIGAEVDIRTPHILTSVVHLWEREQNPLVVWRVRSLTGERQRVVVLSFVEGYSARAVDTVEVEGDAVQRVPQLPTFFPSAIRDIVSPVRATLNLRVETLRGEAELHRTEPVWLHPRSTFPLAVRDPKSGTWRDQLRWLATFVTPNEPSLGALLREAVEHHPHRRLVGYQGGTDEVDMQVRAIYDALKHDSAITYVSSILAPSPGPAFTTQRVRLPRESLAQRQANALDATLLYASLLESISLNPAIALVPGHAFLAWQKSSDDDEWKFLDTTLIGTHEFAEACERGEQIAVLYRDAGQLKLYPLNEQREAGIMPIE